MNISNWIIVISGILAMILPKYLPQYLMLPDRNRFIVKEPTQYRKVKEKQLLILGAYYSIIGLLNLLSTINLLLNMALLFLAPFIIIGKMEKRLKAMYALRTEN